MDEIPGGQVFQNAVNAFNKKAAGAMMNVIKRTLATASEPVFRRDLGERLFTPETAVYAIAIWLAATVASCFTGSAVFHLLNYLHFEKLAEFFKWMPSLIVGLLFIVAYSGFCWENHIRLHQFRQSGQLYHSFSRGVPRWQSFQYPSLILVSLFAFVPVLGAVFVLAMMLNAKIAQEQQALIHSCYLDALDKHLEDQFMEKALLGECEPQVTYLAKPLPNDLDPEVRQDMASACVGKPVRLAATGPKSRKTQKEAATSSAKTKRTLAPEQDPKPKVGSTKPKATVAVLTGKPGVKVGAALALLIVGVLFAGNTFHQSPSQGASAPDLMPSSPKPNSSHLAKPQNTEAEAPAIRPRQIGPLAKNTEHAAETRPNEFVQSISNPVQERERIRKSITAQAKEMEAFEQECRVRLNNNATLLAKTSRSSQKKLKPKHENLSASFGKLVEKQRALLNNDRERFEETAWNSQSDFKEFEAAFARLVTKLHAERQQFTSELDSIKNEISLAPEKSRFLFISW